MYHRVMTKQILHGVVLLDSLGLPDSNVNRRRVWQGIIIIDVYLVVSDSLYSFDIL